MSERTFYLRHKTTIIGVFTFKGNKKFYCPVEENANKLSGGLGYPLGLYPLSVRDEFLRLNRNYSPSPEAIELWFRDRIFPEERDGAENLLKMLNLSEYDPWKIAAKMNAVNQNDYYWMSENEYDDYYLIHPRGRKEAYGTTTFLSLRITDEDEEAVTGSLVWELNDEVAASNVRKDYLFNDKLKSIAKEDIYKFKEKDIKNSFRKVKSFTSK